MTFCLQRYNIARFYALQGFANCSKAQKEYKTVFKAPLHKKQQKTPSKLPQQGTWNYQLRKYWVCYCAFIFQLFEELTPTAHC